MRNALMPSGVRPRPARYSRATAPSGPRNCSSNQAVAASCRSRSFLRRKLLALHEAATAWFEEQLRGPEGAVARKYLAGRGLTPEGIKAFRIGYAPDSFNALRERLSSLADTETLRARGLFR